MRIVGLLTTNICALVAQGQHAEWVRIYDAGAYHVGVKLAANGNGQLYGTGTLGAPGATWDGHPASVLGQQDIFVAKWDTTGHVVWIRTAGGYCLPSDEDGGSLITFDPNSQRVLLSGRFDCSLTLFGTDTIQGNKGDALDKFVASCDSAGNFLWVKGIRAYRFSGSALLVDGASNVFVLGGSHQSQTEFAEDPQVNVPEGCFVAKYGMNGTLLSAQRFLTNGDIYGAAWVSDHEWVIGGSLSPGAQLFGQSIAVSSPGNDGYVVRADTTGNVQWTTTFHSDSTVQVWKCVAGANGSVGITGFFVDSLFLPNDTLIGEPGVMTYFVSSLDAAGTIQWAVPVSSTAPEWLALSDLKMGPDGDLYVHGAFRGSVAIGATTLISSTLQDTYTARFNSSGSCIAAWNLGKNKWRFGSILPVDGAIYISNDMDSVLTIGTDAFPEPGPAGGLFLAKFDDLTGFTGITRHAALNEQLLIYANPNNGLCTIELPQSLRMTHDLVLSVFDNTGQLVQRIPLLAGSEGIKLDIRAQAKGIYHVELGDGEQRYSGSIVFE
jgi:hypothetical protein